MQPELTHRLELSHKAFDDLTLRELYAVLALRDLVFVVGQKITAEPEVDGADPDCTHVLGYLDGELVATARLFLGHDPVKVGRVAVRDDLQRQGLGRELMAYIHEVMGDRAGAMSAQAHLEGWYGSLGWRRVGDVFIEAEIPHLKMTRDLP